MKTRRAGYTLLALLTAALTVMSCTTLLGIDTETNDNPCSQPDLPPLECGVGACQIVLPACVNGLPQACPPVNSTADEICDGIDNNCDGLIDEGCPCMDAQVQNCYSGAPLTRNVGVCVTGIQICTNGVWGDCTGEVLPELENCNDNFDNDCNGAVNDKCPCTEGQQRECYGGPPNTLGVSNCKAGLQSCINGAWGDCKSDIIPGGEVCDGFDNDCNGLTDEISGCECSGDQTLPCYSGDEMLLGVGVCKKGYFPCKGGKWDTMKCLEEVLPKAEGCDGLDNDCNGLVDDAQGLGLDCQTKLPGLCKFGKTGCGIDETTNLPGTICTPDVKPFTNPEQACNLVDDNCDGEIDEGTVCCPDDGIKNGSETDVNCGGTCPQRCPDGKKCNTGADCSSQVCTSGICVAITCADGVKNGTETDIDCGGTTCDACPDTKHCEFGTDCLSAVCINNKCQTPTCIDGVKNGQESDKDCGDACKPSLCANLQTCNTALDCQSFSCKDNICQASTCADSTKNGTETDIDCGGGQCVGCNTGQGCNSGSDCKEKVCGSNLKCLAPTCSDAASNGQETDVDCGGPDCVKRCDTGQKCLLSNDCVSKICTNGFCAPSQCTDQVQNGTETDVDCGGSCPEKCNPTQHCTTAVDCKSDVCAAGTCQAPSCMDSKKNGTETGIDCGGSCINEGKKCADGITCTFGGDCVSGVCMGGVCIGSQCNDQVKNGSETDIDCGGSACQGCDIGKNCLNGPDCKTGICSGGKCAPRPNGSPCATALECASNQCVDGVCCDQACTDTCKACTAAKKGNGADGVCAAIISGADPDNECATDPTTTCGKTGFCSGTGSCATYPVTQQCVPATCKDLVTKQLPQFCNGVGACNTSVEQTCVPYTCQAGNCLTVCNLDSQCASGYYCNNNSCVPKKSDGGTCNFANECLNANCVDGVCCNNACTGACQACSAGKKGGGIDGVCGPIANNNDPDNECAATTASTCGTTGACDGTGKCAQWANGTPCASATCVNSTTLSPSSTCNGSGTCTATTQISCAPYLCKATPTAGCASTCASDLDCASGNYCVMTACVPKKGDGAQCLGSNECVNGNCVDTVCCNNACTGLCQACSAGKKGSGADGTCGFIANNADPDAECMDGQCASSTTLNVTQVCNGAGACKVGTTATCTPYVCIDGPSCPTTCASDANCQSTSYCNTSNQCVAKKATGQTCNNANECSTGFCADGFCCNSACTTVCMSCGLSGTQGSCTNIPNNGTDTNPVCGGTDVCNGSGVCKKGIGQTCATGTDCASTFCADGVCCNTACGATCNACTAAKKGSGTDGTCGTIANNTDPDNECTNGSCDGAGTCKFDLGTACTAGTQCLSGNCVDTVCCDTTCTGTCNACSAAKKGSGTDGTCGFIAVATDPDNECTNGSCNGAGTCKLDQGATCSAPANCLSGNCVDGVCCDTSCTATCNACSAAKKGTGTNGTCGPIVSGQDPDNECANGSCNGSGICRLDQGAACLQPTDCLSGNCVDGVCCDTACAATCNACSAAKKGSGTDGTCGVIVSGQDPDNECTNGSCNGAGQCRLDNGATCATGPSCLSGNCVDSVCCNTACGATCNACTAAKKGSGTDGTCGTIGSGQDPDNECTNGSCDGTGTCKLDLGIACTGNTQCLSGNCVDGVCCNSACTTQCQACNVGGSLGTCTNILPGGQDTNSTPTCTGTNACDGAGACKASNGSTCTSGTECGSGNCVDGVCCSSAACGTCQTCNKTLVLAGTCLNVDVGLQDPDTCSGSNTCNGSGSCVALKPNGQTCGVGTECATNNCVDGYCCDTTCTGECKACNVAGSLGACSNVPDGQTDPNSTPVCNANGQTCNGSGVCRKIDGSACTANNQCVSGVCSTTCQPATCGDGVKNGAEGDIDCGGICPIKCTTSCNIGSDCASGVCSGGACVAAACADGVMNGTETDVDCGGSCGSTCADGKACMGNADCSNAFCDRGMCVPALCHNGSQDTGEAGVDCGGISTGCQLCSTLLVLVTQGTASPYNVQYGSYIGGTWSGTTLASSIANVAPPSLAITNTRYAIGVVRKSDDTLASTRWAGTVNSWGSLTNLPGDPKANGNADTSAFGPYAETAFRNQGGGGRYFTARYTGAAWDTLFQATGSPSNATIYDVEFLHRDPLGTAYLGYPEQTSNDVFTQSRTTNTWTAASSAVAVTLNKNLAPNIVQLSNGDLLMTFVQSTDNKIYWSKFSAGSWSTPAIARNNAGNDMTITTQRPSLTAIPGGGAALAYANSGDSSKLYVSFFDAGTSTWGTATKIVNSAITTVVVAPGLVGYDVEMLYVVGGALGHYRRNTSTTNWETTTVSGFGTNVQGVAAATFR